MKPTDPFPPSDAKPGDRHGILTLCADGVLRDKKAIYEQKLALAAELRAGTALETGLPPEDLGSVRETKVSKYLPGGEKRSLEPEPLPPGPDLSALNPHYFKAAQIHGRKAGRKARTK